MSNMDDVRALGERIGYGNLMAQATVAWRAKLAAIGFAGGEFTIGPCANMLVTCVCVNPHPCDWCCGTRTVTKRVMQAIVDAAAEEGDA